MKRVLDYLSGAAFVGDLDASGLEPQKVLTDWQASEEALRARAFWPAVGDAGSASKAVQLRTCRTHAHAQTCTRARARTHTHTHGVTAFGELSLRLSPPLRSPSGLCVYASVCAHARACV